MLPPGLRSPREVTLYYDEVYFSLINSGQAHPFIYPWATAGAAVVLLYLLIDHRKSSFLKSARFPIFGLLLAFQAWCIATNRARSPAAAFGVGLISSWGTLWVAAIMVANDCQVDFKRIEQGLDEAVDETEKPTGNDLATNGTLQGQPGNPTVRQRRPVDPEPSSDVQKTSCEPSDRLYWQSYPSSPFSARVSWVADVFCSFRGVGWNWQTSGIPPPPKWVEARLRMEDDDAGINDEGGNKEIKTSRTGIRRCADRSALLMDTAISLTIGYVLLDIIKTLMHHDPYFWGYVNSAAPAYLPTILRNSRLLTKTYRLLLSLAGIYTALWTIFKLGPAFFCGVLGPKWLGVRGEPWMNPADTFGSYNTVLTKGLAGWWGGWWHQTFRLAFEAPTIRLLESTGIDKHSTSGKALSLFTAFFLSGCLHASGSYTQLGDTRPLLGPMRFFLLQAVGILVQTVSTQQLKRAGVVDKCPKIFRQATNFVLVHIWLYYTAPLLVDDFATGGVWLFEPVPFSPLRGLGFGAPDDEFFAWWHGLFWWRSGDRWWETGIAL
ncbi:hypothetical protein B0A55_02114 [Friedmanniomyces simplex]|uniref:Wax synthase domain-containing protein n=1 Tax=Friedmanniomyces simplex TaxID=329884 RepID=A0A4U0XNT6_9PEZI|nr:hypothetical protein B0A55_02114 [Friedmanniomyces simplex]